MTIPCNWIDKQPNFTKAVMVDGVKIATIHALTKRDYATIRTLSDTKIELVEGKTFLHTTPELGEIATIKVSLTGHGAGWEFDRPVSDEQISLLPSNYYNGILDAINALSIANEVNEDVLGNSKEQSGS